MIYVGKVDKNKEGVVGSGFEQVSPAVATHIKVAGKNTFVELKDIEAVYQPTTDSSKARFVRGKNGKIYAFSDNDKKIRKAGTREYANNIQDVALGGYVIAVNDEDIELENVVYASVNKSRPGKEACVCVTKDAVYDVEDKGLFSKTSFMSENQEGKGEYLRARDGSYVKKASLQIPAYKTLDLEQMTASTSTGKLVLEYVMLSNGEKISLPNDNVKFVDGRWLYNDGSDTPQVCQYVANEMEKFLIKTPDGDHTREQIVDFGKLTMKDNEVSFEGEKVAQLEVEPVKSVLDVEFSSQEAQQTIEFVPTNTDAQNNALDNNTALRYVFHNPNDESDLEQVQSNADRTFVRFIYKDRYVEYVIGNPPKSDNKALLKDENGNDKERTVIPVSSFSFEPVGKGRNAPVKFSYTPIPKMQQMGFATDIETKDIEIEDGKVTTYSIGVGNGERIEDIKWNDAGLLVEYKFRGCTITITRDEKHAGRVVEYKVKDADGKEYILSDLKGNSRFSHLYVNCKLVEKLEEVKWNDGIITQFKLGDYRFSDIVWNDDATINKCTIKHGREVHREVTIDDQYYGKLLKQLQVKITAQLEKEKMLPLLKTSLFKKEGEKVELNADYVAGKSENGVATATKPENMEHALKLEEEYEKDPYASHFVDENGVVRDVDDVDRTYDATTEFVNTNSRKILTSMLGGGGDISCSADGKLIVKRDKATQKKVDLTMQVGVVACSSIIGAPFGVMVLAVAGAVSVADRIKRASTKRLVGKLNYDESVATLQDNAEIECKKQINNLVKEYSRKIKHAKKEFSSSELPNILNQLRADFIMQYNTASAGLEMLQKGEIESKFDLAKGGKVTEESLLGLLACKKKERELRFGKDPHIDYDKNLREVQKNSLENFYLSGLSEEDKEAYRSLKKEAQKEALKNFKAGFDEDRKKEFERFEIQAQIEVMEKLGGRIGMVEAHKLKLSHLEMYLTDEQKAEYESSTDAKRKKEIMKECKKRLQDEFIKGGEKWGGVDEHIEAFKQSDEYRMERSVIKRRKMVSKKREELLKASRKVSTKSVTMTDRLTPQGENRHNKHCDAVGAYREVCIAQMFNASAEKVKSPLFTSDGMPKEFDYDFLEQMSDADKAFYVGKAVDGLGGIIVGAESLTESAKAKVEEQNKAEELKREAAQKKLEDAEKLMSGTKASVEKSKQAIENAGSGYEDKLKAWAVITTGGKATVADNCAKIKETLDNIPADAVDKESVEELSANNEGCEAAMAECIDNITQERDNARETYDEDIDKKVKTEYLARHRKDFEASKKIVPTITEQSFLDSRSDAAKKEMAVIRRKFDFTAVIEDNLIAEKWKEDYDRYKQEVEGKKGKEIDEAQIKCMFAESIKQNNGEDYKNFMSEVDTQQKFAEAVKQYFGLDAKKEQSHDVSADVETDEDVEEDEDELSL